MVDLAELERLVEKFQAKAKLELTQRLERWPIDLSRNEVHEVIGALLARQVTLACQIAGAPSVWNGHSAPLFLRAMADVHIIAAWIFKDPVERSKQFILYGLGQQKLQVEHRRAHLGRDAADEEKKAIEALEGWINQQRAVWLVEVNVGNLAGKKTRDMAMEADCLDFYNLVYSPFSACAHSMWHHVAVYNLRECDNPLHGGHSVAYIPELPSDLHYFYLGAKYLQKTLAEFDTFAGTQAPSPSAFEFLCDALSELDRPVKG